MAQEQTEPPGKQAKDASELGALPLPADDKHGAAIEGACDVSLVVDEADEAGSKEARRNVVHCTVDISSL